MSAFRRGHRKSENQPDGVPANKKPRSDNTNGLSFDDDDPFADDITGEEWEFVATQAELKHSEHNQQKKNSPSCSTSFKQPQPRTGQISGHEDSKLIAALKSKLSVYETKMDELQSSFDCKNGETLLLRDRLSNAEKQLNQEKMKVIEMQNNQEKQNSEREKYAGKQIEKCKDEVQFKQAELQESQNLIRNLERKIKSLEHQNSTLKSRSPVKPVSTCGEGIKIDEFSTSQNGQYVGTTSNAKKIKLVKPESPRISSKSILRAEFTDKPFEKSTKVSGHANAKAPDPCDAENQTSVLKMLPQRWKLQSKILQHGCRGHSMLQSIIAGDNPVSIATKAKIPSVFQIVGSEVANTKSNTIRGLSENLKRYLSTIPQNMTLFDKFYTTSFEDDASGLLNVIGGHIKTFASFQDVLPSENNLTAESSSYHTAPTEQEHAVAVKTCYNALGKGINTICQNAVSSLHMLLVICEHLPTVCDSKESQELLPVIGRLCNIARWNPKTDLKDNVLVLLLQILTIHAKFSENGMYFKIYEQIVKIDMLLPLITHKNVKVQSCMLDLLNALLSFYPVFAVDLVKSVDCASILCHITDLIGMQITFKSKLRFELLMKSLQFVSNLVANHQSLLIEHSCFSEIYNGVDSLLYSELRSWKADDDEMRQFVIKSALCLLHSCVSVYPDSIPGSRRLHSHQFTMMLLSEFFHKHSDETSFWNVELGRIIETEVKSVMEEGDSS